jgi:hypothetical protein
MPSLTLPPSESTNADEPGPSISVQRRVGSFTLSLRDSWASDSNATMSNLPGPGRALGQLFSAAMRRLELVVNHTATRAGLGFEGIARRLLTKLRAPHTRCKAWPEFAKTPVVELAIELGSGLCAGCGQRYLSTLGRTDNREVEELHRQRSWTS